MKKTLLILGALIVVVYVLMTALVAVHVTEVVVITHFGKPIRVMEKAGLTIKLPVPLVDRALLNRTAEKKTAGNEKCE